jgi:hypothetical protein
MNRARKIARSYTTTCRPERAQAAWGAGHTRTQLRKACAKRGIVYSQMRKDEMIAALNAHADALAQVAA